ncbi:MAG: aromatic ring-hydroxylating dioxygenase subunit alpha, partial [Rhodospirillaceae bacterium]|nr:aromatic ring-hydroxylating dioxygenase subunit alpha [Rhodospirillaceae bacterium]
MAYLDDSAWRYFWHPVCTLPELAAAAADNRALAVTLLGEPIAVAEIAGTLAAFPARCIHRSTRLSIG